MRYLEQDDPKFAKEFSGNFEKVFQTGETHDLKKLTQKILQPQGGLLWEGYESKAPKDARISAPITLGKYENGYQIYLEPTNVCVEKQLFEGLKSFNESKIGEYIRHPFVIYAKSKADNKIIGGCDGHITGPSCYTHRLWVDSANRKEGIGSSLMQELENYAKEKNCQTISLDTAAFQSKEFYEKLGYSVLSVVDGVFFPGYEHYFMSKALTNKVENIMSTKIIIRQYTPDDAQYLANIYYHTIHTINSRDYSEEQVNAWAPSSSLELTGWMKKWETMIPLVAIKDNKIVGFAEFESNGHIDCFYVHHEDQGCGVGSSLMKEIFNKANALKLKRVFAEVSITAKPFFESKGFKVVKQQNVTIRGIELTNFIMEIVL